jgi:hypothetical protein
MASQHDVLAIQLEAIKDRKMAQKEVLKPLRELIPSKEEGRGDE